MRRFRDNHGPEELFYIRLDPIIKRVEYLTLTSMSSKAIEGWDYALHHTIQHEIKSRMKFMKPGESFRMHIPTYRYHVGRDKS